MKRWLQRILTALAISSIPLASASAQHPADEHWGPAEMERARQQMYREMGGQISYLLLIDRFELSSSEGDPHLVLDGESWVGSDLNRLWIKTEGEVVIEDGGLGELEIQALYSRALWSYFDLQAGLRHDIRQEPGPSRSYAVIGLQGLAPYRFELDTAGFLSEEGDLSARVEAEYDLLISQRLVLQPRLELDLFASEVPELGIGSGLSSLDLSLRLRYEVVRELAPYLGVGWNRSFGGTADFARDAGEEVDDLSLLVGIRLWY